MHMRRTARSEVRIGNDEGEYGSGCSEKMRGHITIQEMNERVELYETREK